MLFVLGEGVLIYAAVALTSYLIFQRDLGIPQLMMIIWPKVLLIALVTQGSLYFNDLYEFNINQNMIELATRLIQSIGMTSIALAVIYFLWPAAIIGKWVFFLSIIILLLFLVSWRFLYALMINKNFLAEKAIMVGSGALMGDILSEIKNRRDYGYDLGCIIIPDGEKKNPPTQSDGIQVRYGFDNLCERAEAELASSIIVAFDQRRGTMPYNELLRCKTKGMAILDGESFYERVTGKILVERINPSWLIFSDGFVKSITSRLTKRLVGLLISSVMLVVFLPLILLVAVAIKLDSRGPILFSQERVGENEKVFILHKFRSMKRNAERATGPVWASLDDPRVTRVGKIIRKLHIDELPQLWNVFRGDLSFVGPRPERPFFAEDLKTNIPYYKERFAVKPGITGWAQINYGYGASEKDALEKLKYDLYYIKNMSWIMDLMIIFHTLKIALLARGAR
jgi:sugar transferase (PEP-CTERM system associated)